MNVDVLKQLVGDQTVTDADETRCRMTRMARNLGGHGPRDKAAPTDHQLPATLTVQRPDGAP